MAISERLKWEGNIEFADKEGYILILKGKLLGETLTLIEIYAPQTDKSEFLKNFNIAH